MVALIISVASVQAQKSQVIAHRGYWKTAGSAQNSITALQKADSIHCYGSEFDVWLTKDNKLVINHDPVYKMKYMEYSKGDALTGLKLSNGENLPSLEQYLEAGKKCNTKLILELKALNSKKRETKAVQEILALVTKMGLMDSFIPLIVPTIASPVVFFYMKQYMESALPLSLIEAARIDGSGEFRTFNSIVLPLMKPAIAVQAIFTFVSSWNNYFTPALILHDDKKKTLPILIAQLRAADWLKFDMGQVYVMITFSILPVIVVYLILSKHIVQGIALGSVKG